ncbi:MAG: TraR/DksA family transcriptional regulator [Spirochaetales bacterium]|nr:TraR/DksA family transcriptional regulator [Spirochaetales bacterium]
MSAEFVEEMREKLMDERADLMLKLHRDAKRFKTECATGSGDSVDLASDESAFKKMEAANRLDAKRLTAVENALKRISENRYGICLKCGKKIPESRLRAMPSAVLCIDCKTKDERRHF